MVNLVKKDLNNLFNQLEKETYTEHIEKKVSLKGDTDLAKILEYFDGRYINHHLHKAEIYEKVSEDLNIPLKKTKSVMMRLEELNILKDEKTGLGTGYIDDYDYGFTGKAQGIYITR